MKDLVESLFSNKRIYVLINVYFFYYKEHWYNCDSVQRIRFKVFSWHSRFIGLYYKSDMIYSDKKSFSCRGRRFAELAGSFKKNERG